MVMRLMLLAPFLLATLCFDCRYGHSFSQTTVQKVIVILSLVANYFYFYTHTCKGSSLFFVGNKVPYPQIVFLCGLKLLMYKSQSKTFCQASLGLTFDHSRYTISVYNKKVSCATVKASLDYSIYLIILLNYDN